LSRVPASSAAQTRCGTADLRAYEFRHDVQTEDIELSTRAMLSGRVTISFCPECRSGELPPATFRALYKQRLRWALGWDQVTLQHMDSIWNAKPLGCAQKAGLYYILPLRWALMFSATLNALITPIVSFLFSLYSPQAELGSPIASVIFLSASGFLVYGVVTLINTMLHEPPRLWPAVLFFSLTGVLYISWQLLLVIVSLSKICTGTDGGWEVTVRSATQPSAGASDAPANPSSSSPPAVQVDASRSVHTSPMSQSSPIGAVFSDRGGVRSFPELDTLALGATGGGGEGGWTYARLNDSAQEGTPAASLSSNPSDSPPRRVPSAGTMI